MRLDISYARGTNTVQMDCVHEIGASRNPESPNEVLVLRLRSLDPLALIDAGESS